MLVDDTAPPTCRLDATAPLRGRRTRSVDALRRLRDAKGDFVSGNSTEGRRYARMAKELADTLGGEAALGLPAKLLVRQIATLTLTLEDIQASIARGESVDDEQLVRASNVLARLLRQLDAKRVKPKPKTFREILGSAAPK
jgi:hypothetical protein